MSSYRTDSYFETLAEAATSGLYRASAATAGPWAPGLQHGGPPSALSVRAAERAAAAETGRSDLVALRFSAEFVGPVPVDAVATASRVVRAARSAVLVETVLSAGDRPCLHSRTWLVRDLDTSAVATENGTLAEPSPELSGLGASFPYGDSIDWRSEFGDLASNGPSRMWGRPSRTLIEDEELTGLQRVTLIGDSSSGVSSELDWQQWSFLNVDLDVHLSRPGVGDWTLLDARTQLGAHGSALTRSTVYDLAGELGCTAQTLVLAPR